ncbi:MAG: mannosyltransferase putative-domain-containing protein [Podila humilis]|nr:MAG: mannosyltransferase putative-domain-containing protein [Podila humilis]
MEQQNFPWVHKHHNTTYDLYRESRNGGRGIVMCVGNYHTKYARTVIKTLRDVLKSSLPIEIYYTGEPDLSPENRAWFEKFDDVKTIDITTLIDNNLLVLEGWAVKPFAMLVSRFSEIILMDSDAYFLQDPAVMFEDEGYKETGTVYFYDRTLFPGTGGDKKQWLESFLPTMSNHPAKTRWFRLKGDHEQESGVVVFDKRRLFLGLLAICKLNDLHERQQVTYKKTWGDKETFWIALEMIQEPYSFVKYGGGAIGNDSTIRHNVAPKLDRVCGNQLHFDFRGQPLWWNSGVVRDKFTTGSPYLLYTAYMKDEDGDWDFESSCLVQKHSTSIMEVEWAQRKVALEILKADRDVAVEIDRSYIKEILDIPAFLQSQGAKGGHGNNEAI